ncbi:MAG: hypothetical protein ICV55_10250 [Coleofasciculus sp. C3-bin4]|jgi:hypothetical protein|nr:hypothetical protein [Coleofasciculus sp. C3-bin4]
MRQLRIQVPRGGGEIILDIAKAFQAADLAQFEATGSDKPLDVVIVHISNGKVEELLRKLQELPKLQVTLIPRGVIALQLHLLHL